MTDISITLDSELMVAHVEGNTDAASELIDGWLGEEIVVVDSGRIIIPDGEVVSFLAAAHERGLSTEVS